MILDPNSEGEYFKSLMLSRQLDYIRHTWGVEVSISMDVETMGPSFEHVRVLVKVPNFIHQLELYNPPPVSVTRRLRKGDTASLIISDALWQWIQSVERHMSSESGTT